MTKKKFSKRNLLIESALKEFSNEYYDTASLNKILEHAGVGKGTFYYHFENKIELYEAVIDELLVKKKEFLVLKNDQEKVYENNDKDIFTFLKEQGIFSAEFVAEYPVLKKLSQRLSHEPNAEIHSIFLMKTGGESQEFMRPLVEDAVRAGYLRTDLPIDFILKLLGFLFNNFSAVFSADPQKEGAEESSGLIIERWNYYIDFIKNGLAGKNDGI